MHTQKVTFVWALVAKLTVGWLICRCTKGQGPVDVHYHGDGCRKGNEAAPHQHCLRPTEGMQKLSLDAELA
jgi:hypothetical protein